MSKSKNTAWLWVPITHKSFMPVISSSGLQRYKQRTHRPKCISSRDGVHGMEQRQKSCLRESSSVRESSPFWRELSCANPLISLCESYIARVIWSRKKCIKEVFNLLVFRFSDTQRHYGAVVCFIWTLCRTTRTTKARSFSPP